MKDQLDPAGVAAVRDDVIRLINNLDNEIVAGAGGGGTGFVTLRVGVPPELVPMAPHLEEFFRGMVEKLYANRHKEPPRKMDTLRFWTLLHREIGELMEQCHQDRQNPNLFLELHDVANYAFLMGLSLRLEQQDASRRQAPVVPPPRGLLGWLRLYRLWPQGRGAAS